MELQVKRYKLMRRIHENGEPRWIPWIGKTNSKELLDEIREIMIRYNDVAEEDVKIIEEENE